METSVEPKNEGYAVEVVWAGAEGGLLWEICSMASGCTSPRDLIPEPLFWTLNLLLRSAREPDSRSLSIASWKGQMGYHDVSGSMGLSPGPRSRCGAIQIARDIELQWSKDTAVQ